MIVDIAFGVLYSSSAIERAVPINGGKEQHAGSAGHGVVVTCRRLRLILEAMEEMGICNEVLLALNELWTSSIACQ